MVVCWREVSGCVGKFEMAVARVGAVAVDVGLVDCGSSLESVSGAVIGARS